MSGFSRLFGMAQKALDKTTSSSGGTGAQGGGTDWRSMVRNAAEALTGDGQSAQQAPQPRSAPAPGPAASPETSAPRAPVQTAPLTDADRAAIARYDYLLDTADPHQIEQVHREAFARLTPAQREQIEQRMRTELPAHEQPRSAAPDDLARAATRTEVGRPGFLKGLLARVGGGGAGRAGGRVAAGAGLAGAGMLAGGALAAVAGGAVVSSVAGPLLEQAAGLGVDFDALASGIDLEALAGGLDVEGLTGGLDELASGAGETVSGLGEQAAGLGEQATGLGEQLGDLGSTFGLPGLGELFNR